MCAKGVDKRCDTLNMKDAINFIVFATLNAENKQNIY